MGRIGAGLIVALAVLAMSGEFGGPFARSAQQPQDTQTALATPLPAAPPAQPQ